SIVEILQTFHVVHARSSDSSCCPRVTRRYHSEAPRNDLTPTSLAAYVDRSGERRAHPRAPQRELLDPPLWSGGARRQEHGVRRHHLGLSGARSSCWRNRTTRCTSSTRWDSLVKI